MFELFIITLSILHNSLALENVVFPDDSSCPLSTYGIGKDYGSTEHCIHTVKESYPLDCYEIMKHHNGTSGIYWIKPLKALEPFRVLCDMDIRGGGWIHMQKRYDGSQDFYLPWRDYKHGFGYLNREHWLGLETIHTITGFQHTELLIEMIDAQGNVGYSYYRDFGISSEHDGYNLYKLEWSDGEGGDSLKYHKGMNFSTYDLDRDHATGNCAEEYLGAWWYKDCATSNLNGKFMNMDLPRQYYGKGVEWDAFRSKSDTHFLSKVRMLLR